MFFLLLFAFSRVRHQRFSFDRHLNEALAQIKRPLCLLPSILLQFHLMTLSLAQLEHGKHSAYGIKALRKRAPSDYFIWIQWGVPQPMGSHFASKSSEISNKLQNSAKYRIMSTTRYVKDEIIFIWKWIRLLFWRDSVDSLKLFNENGARKVINWLKFHIWTIITGQKTSISVESVKNKRSPNPNSQDPKKT